MGQAGLTAPGTVKGKASYMAPEQARGQDVDARADLFALGVILWELCAGRRLFARESEFATFEALTSAEPISPALCPEKGCVMAGDSAPANCGISGTYRCGLGGVRVTGANGGLPGALIGSPAR